MRQIAHQITEFGNSYRTNVYDGFVKDRTLLPYFLILFIISPVLALISGMFNFRQRGAKLTILLFFGALGYSWILNPGMDSHSIVESFHERYLFMSFGQFLYEIELILTLKADYTTANDLFLHALLYFLSAFTEQDNWVMFSLASIFGYFYIKSAWLVYEQREQGWSKVSILLYIFFLFWIGIIGINAPRNFAGGMIFFFGAYSYLKSGKIGYLFLIGLTPFVHFMYLAIAPCFFVYVFLKDRKYLYLGVLLLSLIASVGLSELEPILTSTEFSENKAKYYTGERFDESAPPSSFVANTSFHAQYYREAGRWAVLIIFFGVIFFGGYLKNKSHDRILNGLAGTAILILSLSNFTTSIPALNSRSFIYFGLFALAYLVRFFSLKENNSKRLNWLVYLTLPAILLFLFTQFSRSGDYLDFRTFVSPLVYPLIGDDPVSIKELIRMILDL